MGLLRSDIKLTLSSVKSREEGGAEVRDLLADGMKIGTAYTYADGHIEILAEVDNKSVGEELRKLLKAQFPNSSPQIYKIDYD